MGGELYEKVSEGLNILNEYYDLFINLVTVSLDILKTFYRRINLKIYLKTICVGEI